MFRRVYLLAVVVALAGVMLALGAARSQPPKAAPPAVAEDERASIGQSLNFTEQLLARKIDEQMLFQALSDVARVDKVRYTGPPPRVAKTPTAPGAHPCPCACHTACNTALRTPSRSRPALPR